MKRLSLAILTCCLLVLAGGCLGLGSDASNESPDIDSETEPDTESESDHASDEIDDSDDVVTALEATPVDDLELEGIRVRERSSADGETQSTTADVAAVAGSGHAETVETDEVTEYHISNTEEGWYYFPDLETAIHLEDLEGPLPSHEFAIRNWVADADLAYHGTDEIAGHTVHHVEVLAFDDDSSVTSDFERADEVHVWLEEETLFPVGYETIREGDGESDERVDATRYTELEFDVGLEDDQFEFQPPANATIRDESALSYGNGSGYQPFGTVSEANEAFPFEIATLSEETGYEVRGVTVSDRGLEISAFVDHVRDESEVTVDTLSTRPEQVDEAGTEPVSVDDREAYVYESLDSEVYVWTCERLWYRASGDISTDELEELVRSVDCN